MEGAAKLIEFRGPEQLTRREGLDLFTQLRAQIVSQHYTLVLKLGDIYTQFMSERQQHISRAIQFASHCSADGERKALPELRGPYSG
jgi:hypothetical protein